MNEHKLAQRQLFQDVWKPEMKQTGIHFVFPQLVGKQMSGNDFQPKTVNVKFLWGNFDHINLTLWLPEVISMFI